MSVRPSYAGITYPQKFFSPSGSPTILVFIARQHTDTRYWYSKSVRPSVCSSVRPLRSAIRWKLLDISSPFFHRTVAQSFKFYRYQTFSQNSDGVTPCDGAKHRCGIKISRFSTNKPLYVANDTWYRHSHYRRWIGKRTQAFEWHQLQWPWVTSNPDFKVTILFNVKKTRKWYKIELYVQLNGRPIECRIWSIKRRYFQRSWTTPKLVFNVTPFFDTEYLYNTIQYKKTYKAPYVTKKVIRRR